MFFLSDPQHQSEMFSVRSGVQGGIKIKAFKREGKSGVGEREKGMEEKSCGIEREKEGRKNN